MFFFYTIDKIYSSYKIHKIIKQETKKTPLNSQSYIIQYARPIIHVLHKGIKKYNQ